MSDEEFTPNDERIDPVESEKPARRGRPKKQKADPAPKAKANKVGRPPKTASLRDQVEMNLALVAQMWYMGDQHCGQVAYNQVPQMTEALMQWAASSPKVEAFLESTMKGGGPIGVLMAAGPILGAVAAHHSPAAKAMRAQEEAQAQFDAEQAEMANQTQQANAAQNFGDPNVQSPYGYQEAS